jgi:hypothetical protein
MPTLPSAIDVSESFDSEVRYRLPRRPIGLLRYLGFVPMAVGLFIASWPILFIVFFLTIGNAIRGEQFWFAVIGPLVMFGPFCFPLGGFLVFKGLLLFAGHTEIAIRGDRLYLIDRCGWLRWTRRRPLDKLRGFRVEHGPTVYPDGTRAGTDLGMGANLKADLINGKSVTICHGYPREWLLPLAEDLARRCGHVVASDEAPSAEPIRVTDDCTDPARIQYRPWQPTNSTAILESQPDGLTLTIPPAGLVGGNSWFFVVWCAGWNGILFLLVLFFLPAAFRGEVKWEGRNETVSPFVACLFLTPFLLVGIGSLFALLHRGRRRTVIAVAGDSLAIVQSGLFGTRRHEWSARDLLSFHVRSESTKDADGDTRWTIALTVQPKQGETYRLLSYRAKAELEWIATVVREALRLRPAETQPAPAPVLDRPAAEELEPVKPSPAVARWLRRAMPVLVLLGAGLGWEVREGVTKTGQTETLKNGIIFPWADHPRAGDLAERNEYVSLTIRRWFAYGCYRSSSSHGR